MERLVEWQVADSGRAGARTLPVVPISTATLRRAALGADTASPGSDYFWAAAI